MNIAEKSMYDLNGNLNVSNIKNQRIELFFIIYQSILLREELTLIITH